MMYNKKEKGGTKFEQKVFTKTRRGQHQWTKEELRQIIELWETTTVDELQEKLGVEKNQLTYIVNVLRDSGVKLQKKRKLGVIRSMVVDLLKEMKIA